MATRLHEARRGQREAVDHRSGGGMPTRRAVEWLRALGQSLTHADVPEEKADLVHAIHDRVVVAGRRIESVRLTPAANAHGLALALPEKECHGAPDRI
jgi:hypothetical protein